MFLTTGNFYALLGWNQNCAWDLYQQTKLIFFPQVGHPKAVMRYLSEVKGYSY